MLDAAPEYVFPAAVSFVSPEAQFTPKQVETLTERSKLMFRVKLRVSPELAEPYLELAKAGIRGLAYVQLGPDPPPWPTDLEVRLPPGAR